MRENLNPEEVEKYLSALTAKGIKSEVRTPIACACARGPVPAEIWVLEDGDLERAQAVVSEAEKSLR